MGLWAARPRRGNFSRLGPVRGRPGCDVVGKASTGQSKPTRTTATHLPFRYISLSNVFPRVDGCFHVIAIVFLRRPERDAQMEETAKSQKHR